MPGARVADARKYLTGDLANRKIDPAPVMVLLEEIIGHM